MALADEIRRFAAVPILRELEPEALRLIAFSAETRILQAGDRLFGEGEPSEGGFVVVSGSLALTSANAGKASRAIAGPASLLGEMALIADVAYPLTATAQETVTVLKISRALFHRVLGEFPEAAVRVQRLIAGRLAEFAGELERFASSR